MSRYPAPGDDVPGAPPPLRVAAAAVNDAPMPGPQPAAPVEPSAGGRQARRTARLALLGAGLVAVAALLLSVRRRRTRPGIGRRRS